jgi:PAS domain S-box-containing protein
MAAGIWSFIKKLSDCTSVIRREFCKLVIRSGGFSVLESGSNPDFPQSANGIGLARAVPIAGIRPKSSMNETAVWVTGVAEDRSQKKPVAMRLLITVSGTVVFAGIAAALCLFFEQDHLLVEGAGKAGAVTMTTSAEKLMMVRQLQRDTLGAFGLTAVGALGFFLAFRTGSASWRKLWMGRMQARDSDWQRKVGSLEQVLTDTRRDRDRTDNSKKDLEERVKQLTTDHDKLQEELNKRTRAELVLTKKRQELESSRNVLEVHVQARSQELQRLQQTYEMILNSAGEGICGMDLQGRTTFVNPAVARMTGWSMDELLGKTEHQIFFGSGADGRMPGEPDDAGDQVFWRKDGTRFPVESVRTPIQENGRVVGSVLIFKDITERKRAHETLTQRASELARSNSELEQFAFVASHDLQEPLRKIQAFGDRVKIKAGKQLPSDAEDYLGRMQNAAARMRTLIDDLLAFSRVIRSSEPFVTLDLNKITKEVLGDLEVRIEKNNARVLIEELPCIEADPMQMRQLLLNLIGNALKFQPPGGQPVVKISARKSCSPSGEEFCELLVQDNGIGFEEEYSEKIFAVFQRLHNRDQYEGTGVGLAVCRRIVDRHHGTIVARSKLGQGATFTVSLPMKQAKGVDE